MATSTPENSGIFRFCVITNKPYETEKKCSDKSYIRSVIRLKIKDQFQPRRRSEF